MTIITWDNACAASQGVRSAVSLLEVVVLAEIQERDLRKDIERGILTPRYVADNRLVFRWGDVFTLAAIYKNDGLGPDLRRKAFMTGASDYVVFDAVCSHKWTMTCVPSIGRISLGDYVFIDMSLAWADVAPRVELYFNGLRRTEEKEGILGGDAVFRGTRLSVRHIGEMYEKGEPIADICTDYPYLEESDVKFANLYYRAHPMAGRPRNCAVIGHAKTAS